MTSHGLTSRGKIPPEYEVWRCMRRRCYQPDFDSYPKYGGKGIKVCKRWHNFGNFMADMGPRPSKRHSIDRLDARKDYSPSNCKWATPIEQASHKSSNVFLKLGGEKLTISEWSRRTGISKQLLRRRHLELKWSVEKTLMTPVRSMRHG
jgi:hypothetical protein